MNATSPTLQAADAGAIRARGLVRRFGEKLALAGVELEAGPGGVIGLLGPNGSGKSTFLRILYGLVRPDEGSVELDGVRYSGDGLALRQRASYAPGEIALYGELTGERHLAFLLRGREPEALERASATARELGLPLERRVRGYSHGMKRQLLLSAALAPRVRIRILDEPSEGLDPAKRGEVLALLEREKQAGTTILLSSHHLGEIDRICDRLVFFHAGKKIADETREQVLASARRLVRVSFERAPDPARLSALAGVARVRVDGPRASLELAGDDPRPFLAALAADAALGMPASIEYGALSLPELMRELYGVEAC
ncbi:MAG: ABC transporter ATP-binding protein [Planctomycetes bacterium]|nr:ABC transporter ATP-binding protein [Planctomycetota bacterium]